MSLCQTLCYYQPNVVIECHHEQVWSVDVTVPCGSSSVAVHTAFVRQIQIQQLFLLRPLQSDRWRITEVSQHVFHSRRQTETKMF